MPARTLRVLVTHGSKRGGTAEIAEMVADTLRERGLAVDCLPAAGMPEVTPYDAVIVGGALYMMRWHRAARRFVKRSAVALAQRPVWMFSSGPFDDSAPQQKPVRGVAKLMAEVGARGHVTFGGRLARDARGFVASKMAEKQAGDWRDPEKIRSWATSVAGSILASPAPAVRVSVPEPQPRSPRARLVLAMLGFAAGIAVLIYEPTTGFLVPGLILVFVIGAAAVAAHSVTRNPGARSVRP
ncbi:MAG TPA: flavodoxin domain-containing protein [Kofleriaceae bacterium]